MHAEQAEIPRPISPPAHIAPIGADAITPTPSSIAPASLIQQQYQAAANAPGPSPHMVQMVNSPPLPSFIKLVNGHRPQIQWFAVFFWEIASF